MTAMRRLASILTAVAVLAAGATSAPAETAPPGDIPDTQAFVASSGPGYSLKTPEGWGRTTHAAITTWADKFNSIRVEIARSAKPPSMASARRLDAPKLRATTKGFRLHSITRVVRPAGAAVLMTYTALSAPSSVTRKAITNDVSRYAFWRAGRLATITLAAPRGSDNVDAWRLITTSFRWAP